MVAGGWQVGAVVQQVGAVMQVGRCADVQVCRCAGAQDTLLRAHTRAVVAACGCVWLHTHTHTHTYHIHIDIYICICICHMYTHMHMHMCVCVHTRRVAEPSDVRVAHGLAFRKLGRLGPRPG